VGLIDVSTLGKIEVRGRDAARLLERVYTGTYANLAAGRVRYGLMCNEEGIILDDGLVCRLGEDHYYLTTTSSGANSVFEWLTWWSAAGGWQAHVTNVTAGFGAVNLAGPRARDALSGLVDTDVSRAAFPYMHVRQASVAGVPARLLRVGFVGELGYEIHFPAEYGEHVWGRLMQAGAGFGMAPFGVEAQRVLRLEKKHIIVGQDTDALSDPYAANMGWAVHLEKEDFVGKASLAAAAERDARERLIGFEMGASAGAPAEGEQIVEGGRFIGRVTSARYSPTLGKPIGLAWVLPEWACEGAVIQVRTGKTPAEATVVCRSFYDPAGERLRM
jgi:sarcosine oxidase subunit alpha